MFADYPLEPLFPSGVLARAVTWEGAGSVEAVAEGVALPPGLEGAVPKRQVEALAGRVAAARAIRQLPGAWDVSVGRRADRSPEWPPGLVGAITHTAGFAAAAVALAGEFVGVGLDAERWLKEEDVARLRGAILRGDERAPLQDSPSPAQGLTLAFSAKESIYKALFPRVRRFFGFEAFEVRAVDWEAGRFSGALAETLTAEFREGMLLEGRFSTTGFGLLTAVAIRAAWGTHPGEPR